MQFITNNTMLKWKDKFCSKHVSKSTTHMIK